MTSMSRSGRPRALARRVRTPKGDWVELATVSRPSRPNSAMATRGSMAAWSPGGKENSPSTTTGEAAKAARVALAYAGAVGHVAARLGQYGRYASVGA
jgi:hypothetical protein